MMIRYGFTGIGAVIALALGAIVVQLLPSAVNEARVMLADRSEPIVWETGYAAPTKVHAGETVVIAYTGTRYRYCEASVTDFLIGPDGRLIRTYGPTVGGYTAMGRITPSFQVRIPDRLPPGIYVYRSRITHRCENGIHNSQHPPDVPVEVVG